MITVGISDIDYMNRLFCTFTSKETLDETLGKIRTNYTILYNKIFVLESKDCTDLLCTYNIDTNHPASSVLSNTILLHRKKETNTLYTINALNILIKQLNGGVLDTSYKIPWLEYKNTVLLTQGEDLRLLSTKIHNIISL
jgi:hypothetical protein